MLIGAVAEQAGVSTKTLRFYEGRGLLPPPARTAGGYRSYDHDTVERVSFIKDAQASGFTLEQVGEILAISDRGDRPCDHVAELVERRLAEVEERLRELRQTRRRLRQIAEDSLAFDPDDCEGYCGLVSSLDDVSG